MKKSFAMLALGACLALPQFSSAKAAAGSDDPIAAISAAIDATKAAIDALGGSKAHQRAALALNKALLQLEAGLAAAKKGDDDKPAAASAADAPAPAPAAGGAAPMGVPAGAPGDNPNAH